uniref:Uncharacterized protein n=1 Tax=Rhizophora mucronata TaxID=61149 RepID=A0A2P2R2F3_RHIMU
MTHQQSHHRHMTWNKDRLKENGVK